ncbi:hypothetical protein [Ilumatobacter sp.]|uniref:hypothetical protein n=1 Tax=Ilumatobacter sp. TaxID=1967498 RepID=UPI003C417D3D
MSHEDPSVPIGVRSAGRWDLDALRAGAAICLVVAIPFTLLGLVADGARVISFFGAVAGFIVGSGSAAWVQQRGTPLSHALVTAIGTYVAAQTVFILLRLITGREVNWFGAFFTLSLVSFAGLIGGFLGSRLQAKGFVPSSRRTDAR